jgi:predicted TIM-barrel fold metal-dependent hydrolase
MTPKNQQSSNNPPLTRMRIMAYECIDAHHHLWRYQPEDYPWMVPGMEGLRRDYLTAELEEVTLRAGRKP